MTAFYNELDPFAAAWLRNLIAAGHIAPGDVDERSIEDIRPDELAGYGQCHFFAGIGGWSKALRLAGWPDELPGADGGRRVWTGSCPCQPFSAAGKRAGFADERHLWPAWFHLIGECRPDVVFGEQVAGAEGMAWFDLVSADLEGAQYAVGASNLCAAGLGAPHKRQRLWFVANAEYTEWRPRESAGHDANREVGGRAEKAGGIGGNNQTGSVAHAAGQRRDGRPDTAGPGRRSSAQDGGELGDAGGPGLEIGRCEPDHTGPELTAAERTGAACIMEHTEGGGLGGAGHVDQPEPVGGMAHATSRGRQSKPTLHGGHGAGNAPGRTGIEPTSNSELGGPWANAEWLPCSDGKARPVEPGTFPLAHGVSARVGRLRGYGNAIIPQVAAAFIRAAEGAMRERP